MSTKSEVVIYTDGACSGNPGPGGWAAIIEIRDKTFEMWGGELDTTNNRMELTAVIKALRKVPSRKIKELTVVSDSKYVIQGISEWLPNWKSKGWKNSEKKEVKNLDLWKALDELSSQFKIQWEWIKGHSDHPFNERCDELARDAIKKMKVSL